MTEYHLNLLNLLFGTQPNPNLDNVNLDHVQRRPNIEVGMATFAIVYPNLQTAGPQHP